MIAKNIKHLAVIWLICLLGGVLAGCGPYVSARYAAEDGAESMRQGPGSAPQKNLTSMAECLRCMDNLLLENDIRDIVVLAEDLNDNTKKLNVGGRDMLISAVSDMTRRSRAIRLITFGGDLSNLVNWHNASGANSQVYTFRPDFDIRGSISQMDDSLTQQRKDAGITLNLIDFDWSDDAKASIIALDMSIISTRTMELLPGVTSRNSIMVVRDGKGLDAGVYGSLSKEMYGINYSFSFNRNEGSAQAVRTLIELAAIELFGKLTRIPYWNCLGIDSNHPLVREEIGDWYYSLSAERKLIPYIKNQLRIRNVYSGPLDGSLNPEFLALVPRARKALGLHEGNAIDEDFLAGLINLKTKGLGFPEEPAAHLTAPQKEEKRNKSRQQASNKKAEAKAGPAAPRKVEIVGRPVKSGGDIALTVKSKDDTYLYCYLHESGSNSWVRIHPNRFAPDPWLGKNASMDIPGKNNFQIKAGGVSTRESVYCFNTSTDVFQELPSSAKGGDFELLENYDLNRLRADFSVAANGAVAESKLEISKR